jgi:hypothetical protein
MTVFLRIIGQLFLILLGYAVATMAASAFVHLLFLGSAGFAPEDAPWLVMGSIVFSIPLVALFIAYFAFIPAAVAIGIAEIIGARDWLYYAIAGAIVGACVIALFWYSMPYPILLDDTPPPAPNREPLDNPYVVLAVIGGGMLGGIFYWLVAGRLAGDWRGQPISPERSGS